MEEAAVSRDSLQSRLRAAMISFVARHDDPEELLECLGKISIAQYSCEYAGYRRPGADRVSWSRIADFCSACPAAERCPFFDPESPCFDRGEVVALADVRADGLALPAACPVRSALVARVRYRGECWAVMALLHVAERYAFVPSDLENMELATSLVVMLLDRAGLVEERRNAAVETHQARTQFSVLRDIIENIPVLFYTKDAEDGTYRVCNQLFADFAGKRSPEEVYGLKASEIFDPRTAEGFDAQDLQVAASGGRIEMIESGRAADGSLFHFKTIKVGMRSLTGRRSILGLSVDITSEQNLMRQVEQERDRAVAAEKAKSQFFSAVSHDIRTPLNAIIGFAELLDLGVDDPADRRHYLKSIRSSGNVLMSLINDVLDLSKLELGKLEMNPEPTDVPALVREVVGSFGVMAEKKDLAMEVRTATMPRFNLDPQRVRQILINLIGNAVKFTAKGSIAVRAAYDAQTGLSLSVRDTGCGIAPEDQARVLEPFVQLRPSADGQSGTGLGLAICRRLAARMDGSLTLRSELGKGTTFTLSLPAVEAVGPAERPPAADDASVAATFEASRLSVLVVDDSKLNRIVAAAMLKRLGVTQVELAEDGRQALELLRSKGLFDDVLTDLWMPEMSGTDLVRAIRADPALSRQRVSAVTADVEALKTASAEGFSEVLLKPITIDTLRTELAAVLTSR